MLTIFESKVVSREKVRADNLLLTTVSISQYMCRFKKNEQGVEIYNQSDAAKADIVIFYRH